MSYAIRVENLGKKYRLGATHAGSVRELLHRAWTGLFGRKHDPLPHELAGQREISGRTLDDDGAFWALRDIAFEVQPGEVVGIIGRNGSGKSTLLKILSQITAPTTGRVELHGRVASLLEVGTGFHPELSGRENVFLNGAILGMTRPEIRRKFDEIVAFAEIEKFIDTPVKRYSSGMYVRLAFAVAAHLEPEILLVDEVLAVGDIEFQNKCLGQMQSIGRSGRTVFLVSHNLGAIQQLCSKVIVLDIGRVQIIGAATDGINEYVKVANAYYNKAPGEWHFEAGKGPAFFVSAVLRNIRAIPATLIGVQEGFTLEVEYVIRQPLDGVDIDLDFFDRHDRLVCISTLQKTQSRLEPGLYRSTVRIPPFFFTPGRYSISLVIQRPKIEILEHRVREVRFEVIESGSQLSKWANSDIGVVFADFAWSTSRDNESV